MPIYEFYCSDCHTIFSFFSKTVNNQKVPLCPKCKTVKLSRHMSIFSSPRRRASEEEDPIPDMDETRMEKAMNLLAKEADRIPEDDPRQAANLMRKLSDMTGLALGPGMEEALRRMEAGEDPEQIEAEMGDFLEEDPFELKSKSGSSPSRRTPPRVDEKLYDL